MLWNLNIVAKYPTKYSFNIISCNAPEMWSLLGQPILWNLISLVKYLVKCNQLLFHEMLVKCKKHFTAVKYCLPFILKNFPLHFMVSLKHSRKYGITLMDITLKGEFMWQEIRDHTIEHYTYSSVVLDSALVWTPFFQYAHQVTGTQLKV